MIVNRIGLSPILILIVIPVVLIVIELIYPIFPTNAEPISYLSPSSPSYFIILVLPIIQAVLANKYIFHAMEVYRYSYSPKHFLEAWIHPYSYYSHYYSYYLPKRYFEIGGYEKPVVNYELVKKILYAEISLFFIFIIIYFAGIYYICPLVLIKNSPCTSSSHLKSEYTNSVFTNEFLHDLIGFLPRAILIAFTLILVIYPVIFLISILATRVDFRFYFAHACMKIITDGVISEKKDVIDKTRYLIQALNSYNIYLRRSVGLQIRDLKGLYSTIISHSPIEKSGIIQFLSDAFEDDNDKLKAARYLSAFLKDEKRFLVKESLSGKIVTWGKLAAVITPLIISIIEIFVKGKGS